MAKMLLKTLDQDGHSLLAHAEGTREELEGVRRKIEVARRGGLDGMIPVTPTASGERRFWMASRIVEVGEIEE